MYRGLAYQEEVLNSAFYYEQEVEPFAVVKKDVLWDTNLSPITKLVFTHLTMLMNSESMFQVRDSYIQEHLGINETDFNTAIKELTENGYIKEKVLDDGSFGYGIIRKYLIVKGVMR